MFTDVRRETAVYLSGPQGSSRTVLNLKDEDGIIKTHHLSQWRLQWRLKLADGMARTTQRAMLGASRHDLHQGALAEENR